MNKNSNVTGTIETVMVTSSFCKDNNALKKSVKNSNKRMRKSTQGKLKDFFPTKKTPSIIFSSRKTSVASSSTCYMSEVDKILEDGKTREQRIIKKLELIHKKAKNIANSRFAKKNDEDYNKNELIEELFQNKEEINNFKNIMDDMAKVIHKTNMDIKETNKVVCELCNSQSYSSLQRKSKDNSSFKLSQKRSDGELSKSSFGLNDLNLISNIINIL